MNTFYGGIDVSSKSNVVYLMIPNGEKQSNFSVANSHEGSTQLVKRILSVLTSHSLDTVLIGLEAISVYGDNLAYFLREDATLAPFNRKIHVLNSQDRQSISFVKMAGWCFGQTYPFFNYNLRKLKKIDIRDILKPLYSYKDVEIIEGHLMPDHIHMLVSIQPKISVSRFMDYLKGKSALMIFDRHENLKSKFGNQHFWSEGYYVSAVGLNEDTIRNYIQDQEKYGIMQDKFRVKEYEEPFKV